MQSVLEKTTIDQVIHEKITKFLNDEKEFRNDKAKRWCDNITRECVRDLAKLQKPYKLIVTCIINQRCGNALVQHVSGFTDPLKDTVSTVHWKNDLLHCIVNVYTLPLMEWKEVMTYPYLAAKPILWTKIMVNMFYLISLKPNKRSIVQIYQQIITLAFDICWNLFHFQFFFIHLCVRTE